MQYHLVINDVKSHDVMLCINTSSRKLVINKCLVESGKRNIILSECHMVYKI